MRALHLLFPATLTAALATGCFNLSEDPAAFCQGLTCGVFVSSSLGSDTAGDGTRDKPYATLSRAVSVAQGNVGVPVYACGEEFKDAVEITSSTTLFGARDCNGSWEYVPEKPTELTAPADAIPLRITGNGAVKVYGFAIRAVDATLPGGSSIGVAVGPEATLDMLSCTIETGSGAPGADSAVESTIAPAGVAGANGGKACSALLVEGADSPTTACAGAQSTGGKGGGQTTDLTTGEALSYPGESGTPVNIGGAGGPSATGNAKCEDGSIGKDGADGSDTPGAKSLGTLDATLGLIPESANGEDGEPGGGGGGGGASLGLVIEGVCAEGKSGGASGGSGGTGGCGGLGGRGGVAGGSSIGLVSAGAKVTLGDITITTANGNDGGDGAEGQEGNAGAAGGKGGKGATGTSLSDGCTGGAGGHGGKGGKGGGGRGGHSIGIAYLDKAPTTNGKTVIAVGTPGKGGKGPHPTAQAEAGVAADMQAF